LGDRRVEKPWVKVLSVMQASGSERQFPAAVRRTPPSVRRPATIRFAGSLDASTAETALARINAVVLGNPREVIVDLGDLRLLDSTGVQTLLTLHKRVTAQGGRIAVINAKDQPLAVLELLRSKKGFFL
jgi:anti-sigma B factor antagonist